MSLNSMYYGPGALADRDANVVVTNPPADVKGRQIVAAVIDQSTPGTTNAVVATGNAASGAADSGNPVKIGGVYNASPPTYTEGSRTSLQTDQFGSINVNLMRTGFNTPFSSINAGADAKSNATLGSLAVVNYGQVFNGMSWDRARGDVSASFAKAPPLAGTDRSITATTTSAQLMAANATRSKFIIQNDSLIDVWINFGGTAVAAAGSGNYRIKADTNREFTGTSGAVNIIAASTTAAISAREF